MQKIRYFKTIGFIVILIGVQLAGGCKKFIYVGSPKTSINQSNIYSSDGTAIEVLTGIYAKMSNLNSNHVNIGSTFFYAGLSADEYILFDQTNTGALAFYTNSLTNQTDPYWVNGDNNVYNLIFTANAAIDGLTKSSLLTPTVKQQLLGEAKFMRAFFYFYMVNNYGDFPLALGTDPEINRLLSRSSKALVYAQIENDLIDAKQLLNINFLDATLLNTTAERVRPTKWVAGALLARTYLYEQKYSAAEKEADSVIASSQFSLVTDLNQVFLKNSKETIWSLQPVNNASDLGANTGEGSMQVLPSTGPNVGGSPSYPVYLSTYTLNNFEQGDLRKTNWVNSVVVGGTIYNYSYKYKAGLTQTSVSEYEIVFRLAEQYLIRAEARARQNNNIAGAVADLNIIRTRARATATATVPNPLPALNPAMSQSSAYVAIEHERQAELFTEWGHRWFDLKRTPGFSDPNSTRADEVMQAVCTAKGGTWNPNWKLYPVPLSELNANPNLKQNPGY